MIGDCIDCIKAHLSAARKWCYGLLLAIVIWSMIVIDTHHVHTWVEKIPGFWSVFTVISVAFLVYFARWLAKSGIEVEESYYE